jgi:ribonuclease Y
VRAELFEIVPLLLGILLGTLAFVLGLLVARRRISDARTAAAEILRETQQDAENQTKEILVGAQEKALAREDQADNRERELDERESRLEKRARELERATSDANRKRKRLERSVAESQRVEREAREARDSAERQREEARTTLERIAGLTTAQARAELIAGIEEQARTDAARLARKIEDEARELADRQAINMMIQASQRVSIQEVVESTVSFIELPSDEMKGRIIGREGRNIRALEMATGIDLIVDDTPRSILVSSFDPVRREIAQVAINRLVEDGRIHPGRIEEVVEKVRLEFDDMIQERGTEAAYGLGISDLHPKLVGMVGKMRYHTCHGQNLLRHCLETAMIAGHMALEIGASVEVTQRAGLLHEIGQVDSNMSNQPILASAELSAKYGEPEGVVHAIRSLHGDVDARSVEAMLLQTAKRISDNRPGARKENLAVFIERLKRLENIATSFDGVREAFAVKAGKEVRVIIDAEQASDQGTYSLCKKIARALERDLSYPGQIKVSVVREKRAIRFAV